MAKLVVTQRDAADILGEWGDRKLRPVCTPASDPLDFSLDATCDDMLRAIADDPEGDLTAFPKPLLLLAWARVLSCAGMAMLEPFRPAMTVEPDMPRETMLRLLIEEYLTLARVPQTAAERQSIAGSLQSAPGSHRLQ